MKFNIVFLILLPVFILFTACDDELYEPAGATGLWEQVAVSEDGTVMNPAPGQQTVKMLIEPNGIVRYYHSVFKSYANGNGPTTFYGTWSMLDGTWLNISTDKWQFNPSVSAETGKVALTRKSDNSIDTLASVQKQWAKNHIQARFTILKLTDQEMEIRLKTFEGEKRYALLFAPHPSDFLEIKNAGAGKDVYFPKLVSDDNYLTIRKEFQTLKTYVFRFRKVTN